MSKVTDHTDGYNRYIKNILTLNLVLKYLIHPLMNQYGDLEMT